MEGTRIVPLTTAARAAALLAPVLLSAPLAAQQIVPVHQEPRHRLLHEIGPMRVLDVQILPGDTTLFHRHDTPITYVTIGTSTTDSRSLGGEWAGTVPREPPPGTVGEVRAVLTYAERPVTHQVTNVGRTLFRLIAVPHAGPGQAHTEGETMPGEMLDESRWFRSSRVTLAPGDATAWHTAGAPVAVVAIRGGRTWIDRRDDWAATLAHSGDVGVVEPGVGYRLRNAGPAEAELVLVEAR